MKINNKLLTTFGLMVITILIVGGCSSSADNGSSDKAASEVGESNFKLIGPFSEERPKVRIHRKYTCHGDNLSPSLTWSGAPSETVSYALIAEDVDNETGSWVHWMIYNIPGNVKELAEGIPTSTAEFPDGTIQGLNDHKRIGWEGPCPVQTVLPLYPHANDAGRKRQLGAHRYQFTLYALDSTFDLPSEKSTAELLKAMEGHVLAEAKRVGKFALPPLTQAQMEQGKKSHLGTGKGGENTTSTGAN